MKSATSVYLKQILQSGRFTHQQKEELIDIELFALYGTGSFGDWSYVQQGWRIDRLIKKYFKHYIAIVQELKGLEDAKKTRELREYYMTVKPQIMVIQPGQDIKAALRKFMGEE